MNARTASASILLDFIHRALHTMDKTAMHSMDARCCSGGHCTGTAASELRRLIEERVRERVTLRTLGDALGLSPFQTLRVFRRHFGLTPHQYLMRLRVDEAAHLLRHGEPIAEVAAAVGFADQSHMAKHFKRLLGVTPSHYRSRDCGSRLVA